MVPMRKHNNFNYLAPDSLELVTTYLKSREDISILAGGTDLIPLIKYGVKKPALLLNLGNIQFLKNIEIREDGIFIGSMITLNELGRNQTINHHFPFVGYSARCVGSPQIRNMGTIGGNILQDRRCIYFNQTEYWRKNIAPCFKVKGGICHQVPSSKMCHAIYYSDLAPIMLAFDTKVELYDGNGVKVVPLKDIIHKHINDSLDRCILTRFFIPYPAPDSWGKFIKYSVRAAIDFSIVNVAVRYSSSTIDRKKRASSKDLCGSHLPRANRTGGNRRISGCQFNEAFHTQRRNQETGTERVKHQTLTD